MSLFGLLDRTDTISVADPFLGNPMNTRLADEIYEAVNRLPDSYAREALNFVEFLAKKIKYTDQQGNNLIQAQEISMRHVWDNDEDEVWNDIKPL